MPVLNEGRENVRRERLRRTDTPTESRSQTLNRLVGMWKISGEAEGTVTYEWMEGGFFLIQYVDLEQDGQRNKGLEIIGHVQPFGGSRARTSSPVTTTPWATPSTTCTSSKETHSRFGPVRRVLPRVLRHV